MAYQTGTATGPDGLLDAFRTFLAANGWTQNKWSSSGAGMQLCVSKGQVFANMRSLHNEAAPQGPSYYKGTGICLNPSTGFDAAQAWSNQPGKAENASGVAATCALYEVPTTPITYHFFTNTNPDMAFMVAEVSPGVFHHLGFGDMVKIGAYTGGQYATGSFAFDTYTYTSQPDYTNYANDRYIGIPLSDVSYYPASFFKADVDGVTGWRSVVGTNLSGGTTDRGGSITIGSSSFNASQEPFSIHLDSSPIQFNGVTPMMTPVLYVERGSNIYSPAGYAEHIRLLSLEQLAPGEIVTLGADDWMVFPAHSKGLHSAFKGFAIRKT